jgi:translation initiation factor IF-3
VTQRSFRVNRQIRIPEVRLIDETGEQVGIVPTDVARKRAEEAGLDLVEVSPTARPPVCRILDYGKFKYEQRKKDRAGSKHPTSQLKELRVRPMIDKHDLEYRLKKGREFLLAGHKVQVVCVFKGRQMDHPEHGTRVVQEVAQALSDVSRVEVPPRLMGRRMSMLLTSLGHHGSHKEGAKGAKPAKAKPAPPKAKAALEGAAATDKDAPQPAAPPRARPAAQRPPASVPLRPASAGEVG